jgi:hypothetical protein
VTGPADLAAATTWTAAYDEFHDFYQEFYLAGLRDALGPVPLRAESLQRLPGVMRALRRVRTSYRLAGVMRRGAGRVLDGVARAVGGGRVPPSGGFHRLAGQYEFAFRDGKTVRLVVDAQDSGALADEGLLDRCDVYAKANYRTDTAYPPRVVPAVNGNPLVVPHVPLLRSLRGAGPKYDICCVVRVWGGSDEAAGVEHNLRVLEAVNRAPGKKFLLGYLVAGDVAAQEDRLRAQGIPTTRHPMPLRELWEASAAARVNVIRLGMHNCVPWRFLDLLAMGACVALEQPPQTVWPPPLLAGEHYADLGARTDVARPLATDAEYAAIPDRLGRLLQDAAQVDRLRAGAAAYFDAHASPAAVGRYLLDQVAKARGAA